MFICHLSQSDGNFDVIRKSFENLYGARLTASSAENNEKIGLSSVEWSLAPPVPVAWPAGTVGTIKLQSVGSRQDGLVTISVWIKVPGQI